MYTYFVFQCNRCFIVSGETSNSADNAPTCCGGERMQPIQKEAYEDKEAEENRCTAKA